MKYTDPDGKVTKHKDLKGKDRLKAEVKDIINCKFKTGIFAGANVTLWDVINVGAEVDLGSVESTGSLNNDVKTTETLGVSIEIGVLETLKGNLDLKRTREMPENEEIGNYFQTVKDIITDGEFAPDIGGKIGPISSSAQDEDVKVGAEVGLCVGIGLWINLSEIKDFVKGWINGEY